MGFTWILSDSPVPGKGRKGPRICDSNCFQIVRLLVQHHISSIVAFKDREAAAAIADFNSWAGMRQQLLAWTPDTQSLPCCLLPHAAFWWCLHPDLRVPDSHGVPAVKFSLLFSLLDRPAFQNSFLYFHLGSLFAEKYLSSFGCPSNELDWHLITWHEFPLRILNIYV